MAGYGRFRLSDALPKTGDADAPGNQHGASGRRPGMPSHGTPGASKPRKAGGSRKDRKVETGRGQQAGRQGSS